jgi:hypothetical protein
MIVFVILIFLNLCILNYLIWQLTKTLKSGKAIEIRQFQYYYNLQKEQDKNLRIKYKKK